MFSLTISLVEKTKTMISGSYLLGFYSFKAVSPTDDLYADRDKFLDPFIGIYVYILYSLNENKKPSVCNEKFIVFKFRVYLETTKKNDQILITYTIHDRKFALNQVFEFYKRQNTLIEYYKR